MTAAASRTMAWVIARTVAGLLGVLFAWYGVWYGLKLFGGVGISKNFVLLTIPMFALTAAGVLLVFAALAGRQTVRLYLRSVLLGGLFLGGVAFALGFFGPIVVGLLLGQDSPQGPMLGIFFTGPLGFVAGCILGVLLHKRVASIL